MRPLAINRASYRPTRRDRGWGAGEEGCCGSGLRSTRGAMPKEELTDMKACSDSARIAACGVFDRPRSACRFCRTACYETPGRKARQAKGRTLEMAVCEACRFHLQRRFRPGAPGLRSVLPRNDPEASRAVFQAHLDRPHSSASRRGVDIARRIWSSPVRTGRLPRKAGGGCARGPDGDRFSTRPIAAAVRAARATRSFTDGSSTRPPRPAWTIRPTPSFHAIRSSISPIRALSSGRSGAPPGQTARCASFWRHRARTGSSNALQFHDLFYEHCSIFTAASLHLAMERAGFTPTRIEHVFGGQYLWAEFLPGEPAIERPPVPRLDTQRWQDERARYVGEWQARIDEARRDGPVYLWAPAPRVSPSPS